MKQPLMAGIILFAFIVLTGLACMDNSVSNPYGGNPNPGTPPANTFLMSNMSFSPTSMTVAKGTTVTWHNSDAIVHTSTSDSTGLWDTGDIAGGTGKATTFNSVGTFHFHCKYHRSMGMVGTIMVQ
jgi:plastocyanin